MVAPPMTARSVPLAIGTVTAFAFLVQMIISGALPEQKQFVKFEAQGVMHTDPLSITRVVIRRGRASAELERHPGGAWAIRGGKPLSAAAAGHASLAVQFMNTAGPIRIIKPEEFRDSALSEFGLDSPRLAIELFQQGHSVLSGRFGSRNPGDIAQYFAIDDRSELLLMSLFVGREWEALADAVLPQEHADTPVHVGPAVHDKQ
jgi:hypothetical protein